MADVLTQLQTCYDQLLTQMFATLSYLSSHHAYIPPTPNDSDPFSRSEALEPSTQERESAEATFRPYRPDSPDTFAAAQKELARDLVLKEQQIEELIMALPGIRTSEQEQEARIKVLESELREVERRRKEKRRDARKLVERVEDVVMAVAGQSVGGRNTTTG